MQYERKINSSRGISLIIMGLAIFGSNRYLKDVIVRVTQNGDIKHPREDRHPRGRSRRRKLV
uniref:SFRICE_023150 n=1 Tax=Spodoptera frugiperda TaxID=7108 RepID=A0A2H1W9G2_SPOFR